MSGILVTGGAGFIGSNFVHYLVDSGALPFDRVVVLDALTYAGDKNNVPQNSRVTFVHGDIMDQELVSRLLSEHHIGRIVHFAAESHVDRSIDTPEPFVQTNVVGTLRLLDVFRRHWKSAPAREKEAMRFLHVSTDEVFGSLAPQEPAFSETTRYMPNSPYAASKAGSDHLVRSASHTYGLPILITHCSNNYGPRQFPEKLIPLMILNALEGKPLPIYGDGAHVRDWLYVEDHCAAIARVLQGGTPGESYNIGGEAERSNLVLIDSLIRLLDTEAPRVDGTSYATLKTFVPDRPGHDRRYAMDIRKIQRELGWAPKWNLELGLRDTVQWYLKNRAWCDSITSRKYARERLGSNG